MLNKDFPKWRIDSKMTILLRVAETIREREGNETSKEMESGQAIDGLERTATS